MTGTTAPSESDGEAAVADAVRIVVLGPNALGRSCIIAGLVGGAGVEVRSCDSPATDRGPTPDVVLLQAVDAPHGDGWLSHHLRLAASAWPQARLVVLAHEVETSLRPCLEAGVHACLPSHMDLGQVMTALCLLADGLVVYPAKLLAIKQMPTSLRLAPLARVGGIARD